MSRSVRERWSWMPLLHWALCFAIVATLIGIALPVAAHSMGCRNTYTGTVTVPAGGQQTVAPFFRIGPTDKTWVVIWRFGIAAGFPMQNTQFGFGLYETGPPLVLIATQGQVAQDWNSVGSYNYANTLTSHGATVIEFYLTITNYGTASFKLHL